MTEQNETTKTAADIRAEAVQAAAEALGDPSHYLTSSDSTHPGEAAGGVMGALGGRTTNKTHHTGTQYDTALIAVAAFIETGRLDRDDFGPELQAAARAFPAPDSDEVEEHLRLVRKARQ